MSPSVAAAASAAQPAGVRSLIRRPPPQHSTQTAHIRTASAVVQCDQVSLLVQASSHSSNKHGSDLYKKILFMRLDGMTVRQIASKIGCCKDTVSECIDLWQTQIAITEGGPDNWSPPARNPRRSANKPKNAAPSKNN